MVSRCCALIRADWVGVRGWPGPSPARMDPAWSLDRNMRDIGCCQNCRVLKLLTRGTDDIISSFFSTFCGVSSRSGEIYMINVFKTFTNWGRKHSIAGILTRHELVNYPVAYNFITYILMLRNQYFSISKINATSSLHAWWNSDMV